jgi:hypothetical protein
MNNETGNIMSPPELTRIEEKTRCDRKSLAPRHGAEWAGWQLQQT